MSFFLALSNKNKIKMNAIRYIKLLLVIIFLTSCKVNRLPDLQKTMNQLKDSSMVQNPITKIWENDPFLNSLIDSVVTRNLSYKLEYQQIQIAKQQFVMGASFLKPFTSLQFNPNLRKFGKYTMDGVGNYDTQFSPNISSAMKIPETLPDFPIGLQTNWEIDIWGKLTARKKAQALRYMSTEEGYKWLKTQLVAKTAIYYGELVALDRELDILNSNIEIQRKAVELVKIQKEAGVVNEMAVLQLEAQLENSRAQVSPLQSEIIAIENEIKLLLNDRNAVIKRTLMPIDSDFSKEYRSIHLDYLSQRSDVKQAQLNLEAQIYDKESARLALKPSLVFSNFLGVQSFQPAYLFQLPASLSYQLMANISKPILNRGLLKGDLAIAENKIKSFEMAYLQTLNSAFLEWDSNIKGLDLMNEQIKHKSKEVELNFNAIQTVRELFQTNKANYLEILTAQQNTLKSELDLLEIYKKRWIYSVQLYKILGGN
jgi:outer membrane protein TolC